MATDALTTVVVRDSLGKLSQIRARYVISAISPKLLKKIEVLGGSDHKQTQFLV